jgi:cellulose synthase/poly-beta-1,6-N-acetylglucosamine synthase-like glycosyltransferase
MIAKPTKERFGTPRIIFQITTKGNIPIVQETVNRVNSVCREIEYEKYELWVVTDVQEKFENCRTITVPAGYSCNAIYKGRALQYAVELRRKENKNTDDIYVFHLDDESLITKQTLCSLLTYLEGKPAPISEGLIVYPIQEKEKIKVTNLLDTLRPFCCFECLDFMSRGRPAYIHGSNLLVRSDFEEEVGWANGKTIAEDTLFAVKAKNMFGPKIFGWHGGVIEEKSPATLKDLIKQRKRWFYGLIQNMKYFPTRDKISQSARAFIWSFGFVSALTSILAWVVVSLYPYLGMPGYLRIIFSITSLLWLFSYQIGAYFNGNRLQSKERIKFHLLALVSAFVIGFIECSTPLVSLINKPKTFEVIKK